jgi:hypothetical protein
MSGPIEVGFIEALTRKAMSGRAPPIIGYRLAEDREGEEHARLCLDLARMVDMPTLISDELISVIDGTFGAAAGAWPFVWTICVAAAVGALN